MNGKEKFIQDFMPDSETAKEVLDYLIELEEDVEEEEIKRGINTIINNPLGFSTEQKPNADE